MGSILKILLVAGILTGCIHTSDGITSDCNYFLSMTQFVPTFLGDMFSCIFDERANFLSPQMNLGNFMCIIKCSLMKGGMLDEEGGVDAIGALDMLGAILPPELKPKAEDLVTQCQESAGAIEVNDTQCMSYIPVMSCAVTELLDLFIGGFVGALSGSQPINFINLFFCFLNPQQAAEDAAENAAAEEGDGEAAEGSPGEPEAKRQRGNSITDFNGFINSRNSSNPSNTRKPKNFDNYAIVNNLLNSFLRNNFGHLQNTTNFNQFRFSNNFNSAYSNSTNFNMLDNMNNLQYALGNLTNMGTEMIKLFQQSTSQYSRPSQPKNVKNVVRARPVVLR